MYDVRDNVAAGMAASCVLALLTTACSSLPETVPSMEKAETEISRLRQEPAANNVAGKQLVDAEAALADARSLYDEGESLKKINHKAYVAQRHAEIGQQLAATYTIQNDIESAEAEQEKLLLQAREAEARRSQRVAEQATSLAASKAREADQLRGQLADMAERNADGNLVITLGDVLFDTDKAELKPGAFSAMDRLAQVLKEDSKRQLSIEGHTDSRGAAEYNKTLSKRRAEAVAQALKDRGVEARRISVVGRGEEYPVATNDTAAGRQQNRRVEVIFGNS